MQISFEIVRNMESLHTLKKEWDDLWQRSDGSYVQTFTSCLHSWESIARPAGRKLHCLVGRENGRLVVIWPMVTYRRSVWSIVRQLGPEAAEFTDLLAADESGAQERVAAAWRTLLATSKADIVYLPFVKADSKLHRAICERGKVLSADLDIAPYAKLREQGNWEIYNKTLNSAQKKVRNRKHRRLVEQGKVTFEIVGRDDERCAALIDWLLAQKRQWAERVDKKGAWIFSERYRRFLVSLIRDPECVQELVIFVLRLNDAPVAAQVAAIGGTNLTLIISGFDANFSKCSPGSKLGECCVNWALDRHLDCDFGAGNEYQKLYWSRNNVITTVNYWIAGSIWGEAGFALWRILQRWRRLWLPQIKNSDRQS